MGVSAESRAPTEHAELKRCVYCGGGEHPWECGQPAESVPPAKAAAVAARAAYRAERRNERHSHWRCFWTWPWGHVWKLEEYRVPVTYRRCAACGKRRVDL